MRLGLAFIGAGRISGAHLTGLANLARHREAEGAKEEAFHLAALADTRQEAALALAERAERELGYRPAVYTDYREMLEREPDLSAAAALVPNHAHGSVARDCLETGLHLLLPSPLAITCTEGRRIMTQAHRAGRALLVTEPTVQGREARALIAALRGGVIGTPQILVDCLVEIGAADSVCAGAAWRQAKGTAGGGPFFEVGVHRARFYGEALGPITEAFSLTQTFDPTWRAVDEQEGRRVTTEDSATACLRFAGGALGHLLISTAGRGARFCASRIYGSAGVADLTERTVTREDGRAAPLSEAVRPQLDGSIPEDPFAHAFALLHEQIASGSVSTPLSYESGERALEAMAVIFGCLEAATTGRMIDVADVLSGAACSYEDSIEVARLSTEDGMDAVKPVPHAQQYRP